MSCQGHRGSWLGELSINIFFSNPSHFEDISAESSNEKLTYHLVNEPARRDSQYEALKQVI